MTKELFPEFIKHFVKHIDYTKEKPFVISLDNFVSQFGIGEFDFAKVKFYSFPTVSISCNYLKERSLVH